LNSKAVEREQTMKVGVRVVYPVWEGHTTSVPDGEGGVRGMCGVKVVMISCGCGMLLPARALMNHACVCNKTGNARQNKGDPECP